MSRFQSGLSIIELLVALAVMAIFVSVAIPGFQAFIQRGNLATYTNNMVSAVSLARAEALRLGGGVSIVPVDADDDDNEWGPGWQVQDADGNVIRSFPAVNDDFTIDAAPDDVVAIPFNSRGILIQAAPTITSLDICIEDTFGTRITFFPTGRTRSEELAAGDCP